MRIGILGTGGIGLASAAWLAQHGHEVSIWSPGGAGALALRDAPLYSEGVLQAEVRVHVAASAREVAESGAMLLLAVPVNGHRAICDAVLPYLRDGQTIIQRRERSAGIARTGDDDTRQPAGARGGVKARVGPRTHSKLGGASATEAAQARCQG